MNFRLTFSIPPLEPPVTYGDKILLMGSCFAENIGEKLQQHKFDVLVNPNGILYNPLSIAEALNSYADGRIFREEELFFHNGRWQSWHHHGSFAGSDKAACLRQINVSQSRAAAFIRQAGWLMITAGSAFVYSLKENGQIVSNCHKVPQQRFQKKLLTPQEMIAALDNCLHRLFTLNERLKVLFTVSPVRYVRDGVTENNLSKAALLCALHHLVHKFDRLYYFPAYELVTDDLRDYRFYKEDLVHPNEMAVNYVWEKFTGACLDTQGQELLKEILQLVTARLHRPLHPDTAQHRAFMENCLARAQLLQERYPHLDFTEELQYFSA